MSLDGTFLVLFYFPIPSLKIRKCDFSEHTENGQPFNILYICFSYMFFIYN